PAWLRAERGGPRRHAAGRPSAISHQPSAIATASISLSALRRLRAAERRQVAQQIVEVAIGDPIGAVDWHQRLRLVDHFGEVRLEKALDALARIHDLHGELILVLLDAADALALARDDRDRLVAGADDLAGAAQLGGEAGARPSGSDARQVGAE